MLQIDELMMQVCQGLCFLPLPLIFSTDYAAQPAVKDTGKTQRKLIIST